MGCVEGDRFRVRQYFMRDYHEEAALLHALADDLARFDRIVTFNGKMFDLPLLDARFRLNRARFPLSDAPHFDLLHPARRLWKARLESCRLQSLEAGAHRPAAHGRHPRRADPAGLLRLGAPPRRPGPRRVFDHNRQDIVSLAALSILACQWVEEDRAEDPRDVVSLARVLERARLYERSEAEYRRALDLGQGPLRNAALLRLALRAKRAGDFERAAGLWAEAAEAGEAEALRELAMHHEHRTRDLDAALAAVERGLHSSSRTAPRRAGLRTWPRASSGDSSACEEERRAKVRPAFPSRDRACPQAGHARGRSRAPGTPRAPG